MPEDTIALAADHAGNELKDAPKAEIAARVLGALDLGAADDGLAAFLDTPFEGGRHQRRVAKLG
jgi:ribose 5-phosphate isomerase RpiB